MIFLVASYVLATSLRNLKAVFVGGEQIVDETSVLSVNEKILRQEIDTRTNRIRSIAGPPL